MNGNNVAETYLAKAREGKLFAHVLVDIIDLQDECRQINVEMIAHALSVRMRLIQMKDFGFLPEAKEGSKELTFGFK